MPGLVHPRALALDIPGGHIYWTTDNKIQRANLDGTGVTDLVPAQASDSLVLDLTRGQMYWSESTKIRRANFDGSGIGDFYDAGG